MSETSTIATTDGDLSSSMLLSQSLNSLGSPRRSQSEFSKSYKQASNFFLTRRFAEALSTIEPLISIPRPTDGSSEDEGGSKHAPITKADKKWRIRVWSFYLTLQNAIAELGPEEGKLAFGKHVWQAIVAKAENGSIWDEVVEAGYKGDETRVDGEVVVNLANLLLAQSPDQKANQGHLETYLSAADPPEQSFSEGDPYAKFSNGYATNGTNHLKEANTLRDLETQIQIVELFALHVLPRNGEWDYARDFLSMSYLLDEERRDALVQALNDLQEDVCGEPDRFEDATSQGDEAPTIPFRASQIGRTDSNVTVIPATSKSEPRVDSEQEHGIESKDISSTASGLRSVSPKPAQDPPLRLARKPSGTMQQHTPRPAPNKPARSVGQSAILKRILAIVFTVRKILTNMSLQLSRNPAALLRFVLFLTALVGALTRGDLRERLRRLMGKGMDKVKQTLGMGVKVSYI